MYQQNETITNKFKKMKKFDFRTKLKDLDLEDLKRLRNYHLDWMLKFIGSNDKESDKHSRYVSYIDNAIRKINKQNETKQNNNFKNLLQ